MWLISLLLIAYCVYITLKVFQVLGNKSILVIMIIFTFAQQICSTIYINTGVFVTELNKTTYYVPESTPLFLFYTDVFLLFVYFWGRKCLRKNNCNNGNIEIKTTEISKMVSYGSVLLSLSLAAYTTLDLVISGIPLFIESITHYNYYSTYSTLPFASTINTWLSISMYLLGYAYVHVPKKSFRVTCIMVVVVSMIIRVLMGFRMSGLINIPLNFLAIAFLLHKVRFKNIMDVLRPKYVFFVLTIAFAIIGMFIFSSVRSGRVNTLIEGLELFMNRAFGLGNHLWWAAEADNRHGNDIFGHNLIQEALAILEGRNQFDTDTGVYWLMRQYGYGYIVKSDIIHGTRYSCTFVTTIVYKYGYVFAIVAEVIVARILIWFIKKFEYTVVKNKFLQLLLTCKLWGSFVTYINASGTITEVFNPENYIYFILLGILYHFGRNKQIKFKIK